MILRNLRFDFKKLWWFFWNVYFFFINFLLLRFCALLWTVLQVSPVSHRRATLLFVADDGQLKLDLSGMLTISLPYVYMKP